MQVVPREGALFAVAFLTPLPQRLIEPGRLLREERGGYVELGLRRIVLKRKLPARW